MNKILERQLKKALGGIENIPKDSEGLFKIISETYDHFEEDRKLIEHSLEVSSKEMLELNNKLREEAVTLKSGSEELVRVNKLFIDRELKMIELKRENEELKSKFSK